jgi:type II secretory pathway component PulF
MVAAMHRHIRFSDAMMHGMRTTVTLDPDTEQIVRRRMRERGLSFKDAVNDAIRSGAMRASSRAPFRTEVATLGDSHVNLDRALQLAADLEDDDLIRKMRSSS